MINAELQTLNYILQTGEVDKLIHLGIDSTYFFDNKDEFNYIQEYKNQYGIVPDLTVFKKQFPSYVHQEVRQTPEGIRDLLIESAVYHDITPHLQSFGQGLQSNSVQALEDIQAKIQKIREKRLGNVHSGTDIVATANERYKDYERRAEMEGLLGISTGIKDLDQATNGWVAEDFVVIFARTNVGKSWIGLYLAKEAWKQGKKVLFYAGEMNPLILGYRFDTLNRHISNTCMMNGNKTIKKQYKEYTEELSEKDGFLVVTPKDFKGQKPTVAQLEEKAKQWGADIVFVDQISLMADMRRGKDKTQQYGHIAEDLFLMSERLQKPIIGLAQAGRSSEKDNKAGETPELHHIEYSDLIGQFATRAIGMNVVDKILKLNLQKNRFGGRCIEVLLNWDIDKGVITPILDEETEQMGEDYGF